VPRSSWTRGGSFLLAVVAGFTACEDGGQRRVDAVAWDTVAVIGGAGPSDTTLHQPYRIARWDGRVVVIDATSPAVRVFRPDGAPVFSLGTAGSGPGEFRQISGVGIAPDGSLLLLDAGLRKLSAVAPSGQIAWEHTFDPSVRIGGEFVRLSDRYVFITSDAARSVVEVDPATYEVMRTEALALPDSIPQRAVLSRWNARADETTDEWVSAFYIGPGFFVHRRDTTIFHPYLRPVPFMIAGGAPPDSLPYAARSLDVAKGEIYMLFGGSDGGRGGSDRPPEFIDIYGLDGRYRRSLRMPLDAFTLTTDGDLFYAIQHDPVPAVVVLRPH
jgi:hypothetical protein